IAIGEDGYSQMGIEDIACIRALPNVGIIQPADELETKQVIAYAVEHPGPLYLRLTRQNLEPVCPPDYRFQYGRWLLLRPGHPVTPLAPAAPGRIRSRCARPTIASSTAAGSCCGQATT